MKAPLTKWLAVAGLSSALAALAWVKTGRSHQSGERLRAVLSRIALHVPNLERSRASVSDPLAPGRPAKLIGVRDLKVPGVSAKLGSISHTLFPKEEDRKKKAPAERGGINPCDSPDPGFGIYDKWRFAGGIGKFMLPLDDLRGEDSVNTLFHFAGFELARKEAAKAKARFAFVGVQFPGAGLNYRKHLSGPDGLDALAAAMVSALKRLDGAPAELGHIGLGAWSAGYDGVGVILQQSKDKDRVDAVVLLDGLHASRKDDVAELQLKPFIDFAKRAARKDAFMFVSYSSVPTDSYASTHETGRRLIRALGGEPLFVERDDVGGLELKEMFSKGNFHARGYRGGGELDHCAHLMLYPMALEALNRYWQQG